MLEPLGARYVVVHLDLMNAGNRADSSAASMSSTPDYLRPLEKSGDVWLYEIVGWPR